MHYYRAAVCMDRILLDIFHILFNFRMAKMYGNDGTFYEGTKYRSSGHEKLS